MALLAVLVAVPMLFWLVTIFVLPSRDDLRGHDEREESHRGH